MAGSGVGTGFYSCLRKSRAFPQIERQSRGVLDISQLCYYDDMPYYRVDTDLTSAVSHILRTQEELSAEDIAEIESGEFSAENFGKIIDEEISDDIERVRVVEIPRDSETQAQD